jgi:uridylate kinase
MALVVHKYGGTSLATAARIGDVAARVGMERRAGHDVIVVVSAMGDTTDHLKALATDLTPHPDPRELDMLLTAGERISMSLVAIALNASGLRSISLTGSQSGIITDGAHLRARILDVKGDRIRDGLAEGRVVIVAGFQGVSAAKEVTTLGRGGSDVTAVALAARFGAARCDIFTDVDGVYTADPGRVPTARRVAALDHDAMVAYAELGAGVLHPRAARWARRERVPVVVRSSFIPGPGTLIGDAPGAGHAGHAALPVVGIGCLRSVTVSEVGAPPRALASAIGPDEEMIPFLAIAPHGAGSRVAIDRACTEEAAALAARVAGSAVSVLGTGDFVSIIVRPEADLTAAIDGLVPPTARVIDAPLVSARAISFLLRPEAADETLRRIHFELIEAQTGVAGMAAART